MRAHSVEAWICLVDDECPAGCGSRTQLNQRFSQRRCDHVLRDQQEKGERRNNQREDPPFSFLLLISKSRSRCDSEDCSTDPKRVEPIGRLTTHCGYEGSQC